MCISPSHVWVERGPAWVQTPVPCKGCWQCGENRIGDFVGRGLAEAAYSVRSMCLTLTYAPRDDGAERVVTPLHFQKFIRSLRRRGHSVRYLVAGEYGALRGRAHFHCVLFFKSKAPLLNNDRKPIRLRRRDWIPSWPHGHVFADECDRRGLRYVCKYVLKGCRANPDGWFSMSKKPVLGAEFFAAKAARDAALGVFPSHFCYVPPGAKPGASYYLSGAARRDYLAQLEALSGVYHRPADGRLLFDLPASGLNEWTYRSLEKLHNWQFERSLPAWPDEQAARDERLDDFVADFRRDLDRTRVSEADIRRGIEWQDRQALWDAYRIEQLIIERGWRRDYGETDATFLKEVERQPGFVDLDGSGSDEFDYW